ncbi:MAG: hypothetical protein KGN78_14135 [Actinomycetales bacterium]|nr:hypothetical protein [Actinomycetales bacterium]
MSGKLNLLVAYPYMQGQTQVLQENADILRLVVDSGAFTAWKAGKPIELDDYCRFLEVLPVAPWRYFTLDVIGDPHGTMRNYETLLKRGFKPVPIFTRGEDPSVLEDYYKTSDVVGIGGLVGTSGNRGFVRGIMRHVGKRKVHWLGFTAFEFVKVFRPYMCDSSSWTSGSRFGTFDLYLGRGRMIKVTKAEMAEKPSQQILDRVRYFGLDPAGLGIKKNWHGGRTYNRILGGYSHVHLSHDIEQNLGTKQFLASTTGLETSILFDGQRLLNNRISS